MPFFHNYYKIKKKMRQIKDVVKHIVFRLPLFRYSPGDCRYLSSILRISS